MSLTLEQAKRLEGVRTLHAQGRLEDALRAYRILLAEAPGDPLVLTLLGLAMHQSGDQTESIRRLTEALASAPDFVMAWQHLPLPLMALGRIAEAVAAGAEAVRLAPDRADVRANYMLALFQAQRYPEAARVGEAALAIDPANVTAWNQLGLVRAAEEEYELAIRLYDRALAIAPDRFEALVNKGTALQALRRDAEAIAPLSLAVGLDPKHQAARLNLGAALRAVGRIDEALATWSGAPEPFAELDYNVGCTLLLKGDWSKGWTGYERRFETTKPFVRPPATTAPRWDGTPQPSAVLMVHAEQGLGDTIQFVRLLERAVPHVRSLIFVVQRPLAALIASFPLFADGAKATLVAEGDPIPAHDLWVPLVSLPFLLRLDRTTMPRRAPYLAARPDRLIASGGAIAGATHGALVRVGLSWQGNPNTPIDVGRSIGLARLAPLGKVADVAYVSLQKGAAQDDKAPADLTLMRMGREFDDGPDAFLDTAGALATLDLLITSDTAIAHLAGALGRPVWLLLRKLPDWRWGLSGEVTPWYPSMRLFRQTDSGDWDGVVARVVRDLDALAAPLRGPAPDTAQTVEALFHTAVTAHQARNFADAIAGYGAVIRRERHNARAWNFLGMAILESGNRQPDAARRAIPLVLHGVGLGPNDPDILANAAVVLRAAQAPEDAAELLRHALAIDPTNRAASLNLVNLDLAAGRAEVAFGRVSDLLRNASQDEAILATYAGAALAAGRSSEAEPVLRQAIARDPKSARLHLLFGNMRIEAGDVQGGCTAYETALLHDPAHADAYSNLGVQERSHGDLGVALWFYRQALRIAPGNAEAWCNFGIAAVDAGMDSTAEQAFRKAVDLKPTYADAHMAFGTALLARGDFAAGLPAYEYRLKSARLGLGATSRVAPEWTGQDLTGRTLLILAEQGFGDAIQFIRYAALAKAAGAARVIIGARAKLCNILAGAPGVDAVIAEGAPLPPCDYQIAMMSLPHAFGTRLESIPARTPYLRPDPERVTRWARYLSKRSGFRVGLVWQGNPDPRVDKGRSIPLALFEPLATQKSVRLIALQKGFGAEQMAGMAAALGLESLGEDFDEGPDAFADTAAAILNLDLVITTDTAVAHVAGALGRPVWLLLKAWPEWRWLRGRSDSPWYPSARLFRQPLDPPPAGVSPWVAVLAKVATELALLVAGDRSRLFAGEDDQAPASLPRPVAERFEAALALHRAGQIDRARAAYAAILAEGVDHGDTLHMLGAIALQERRYARALIFLDGAERAGFTSPACQLNRAVALRNLGRLEEAEALARAVVETEPTAEAYTNLGNVLRDCNRFEDALAAMEKAVALKADSAQIQRSLALALRDVGRLAESLPAFDRAIALKPDDPELILDRAHARLAMGDLRQGFADYEARWRAAEMHPRHFDTPRWDGKPRLDGRLLVHGEQGIGDHIQFARFLPLVAERCGEVIVEIRRPLFGLFRSLERVGTLIKLTEQGAPLPDHDAHVPLLSLPHLLDIGPLDLPGPIPYMSADEAKSSLWRRRLRIGGDGRLTVGLIWQGNPNARADKGRSPPLSALRPILNTPSVRVISLQKDHGLDQISAVPAEMLEQPGHGFDEGPNAFVDTAALMDTLDLVITSDTAAAHLAGALGRPTFLMLKAVPDWRWMTTRIDSPWYPTMRLFRQPSPGDWESVAEAVAAALVERRG